MNSTQKKRPNSVYYYCPDFQSAKICNFGYLALKFHVLFSNTKNNISVIFDKFTNVSLRDNKKNRMFSIIINLNKNYTLRTEKMF